MPTGIKREGNIMAEIDGGSGAPENAEASTQDQQSEKSFTQADVDRMITERVSRTKATLPADYAELKLAAGRLAEIEDRDKTDLQRAQSAVSAAEARATAAQVEYGSRLVRAQFDTLAARRNPDVKTDEILEYVDLARLVDQNGEPDMKALAAAVNRLVPESRGGIPGFEGGARTSPAKGADMNSLLRNAAGRGQ